MIQLPWLTYKSIEHVEKDGIVIHFTEVNNFNKSFLIKQIS